MTKEEISLKADEYSKEYDGSAYYRYGFYDGAEWMQERMIEKAAEWLYIYYSTLDRCKSFEDAWKHFEQAMKEGMQETNEGQALLYAVGKTAERTKREMIEKAVEWMRNNLHEFSANVSYKNLFDEFKQAMQNESE